MEGIFRSSPIAPFFSHSFLSIIHSAGMLELGRRQRFRLYQALVFTCTLHVAKHIAALPGETPFTREGAANISCHARAFRLS